MSNNAVTALIIFLGFLLIVLCTGSPDILDGLISMANRK